jgi:ribosomal protein S18 acetylase RimI-like enzyme
MTEPMPAEPAELVNGGTALAPVLLRWEPVVDAAVLRPERLPPLEGATAYWASEPEVLPALRAALRRGYLVVPAGGRFSRRVRAFTALWGRVCRERRWPVVVVSVGAATPFGRRLTATLDGDPVFNRGRDDEAVQRFRRIWEGVFYPALDAWWEDQPQAVGRATAARVHSDPVYSGGASYCTLRAVEGAPRPVELLFDAINAGTHGGGAPPHLPGDDWPAVAEARHAERLAPPRSYRRPPRGDLEVCGVCGFAYVNAGGDKLRHRAVHDRAVNGVRVPRAVQRRLRHIVAPSPWPAPEAETAATGESAATAATAEGVVQDGILVVRPTSRHPLRRLAYGLSVLFQREGHYDFAAVPYPRRRRWDEDDDEDRTRYRAAYLVAIRPARGAGGTPPARPARDVHAVGLLVLRRRPHGGWWDVETETRTPAPPGAQGWAIEIVYVAPAWRRRGIGRQLTEAAARLHGVRPGDLLHSLPLTDAGRLLACATAGTRRLPVAG